MVDDTLVTQACSPSEQSFSDLSSMKARGRRRYNQARSIQQHIDLIRGGFSNDNKNH